MTPLTCACCGEQLPESASTGRPARFLNDAHRKAYERGRRPHVSGRPTEERLGEASLAAAVRKLPERANLAAGLGDGDWCPQSADHGRMYFMKPAMARQWCPSSAHQGSPFYRRDGVTPFGSASPARHDLASSGNAADVKQGRAEPEAPIPAGGASQPHPVGDPASTARAQAGTEGAGQLSLVLPSG